MDVLRLNATTYFPDALIDSYKSCVWTERYGKSGDFQMKTNNKYRSKTLATHGDYHRLYKRLSKRLERRSAKSQVKGDQQ